MMCTHFASSNGICLDHAQGCQNTMLSPPSDVSNVSSEICTVEI